MILHVDMDAFYASVEQRDRPALRGRPVIVGGDPQRRGVVSAASYEARKFGVHSAMPSSQAVRLCPDGVFLPGNMERYAEVSGQIREIFHRYTPLVEPLSLDEAFLDVTGSEGLFGPADEIAKRIRSDIRTELNLTASAGVAVNKYLAKIASDLEKPDGLVIVAPSQEEAFLDPLPVERIWGVGKVSAQVFRRLGIATIGELRRRSVEQLQVHFGETSANHLWQLARGIDDRSVVTDHQAKSISHETTFAEDIDDQEILTAVLLDLTDLVARRVRRHGFRARTVHLKVRFSDFQTLTRSQTLRESSDVTRDFFEAARDMLDHKLPKPLRPVRLIGIGTSGFGSSGERQTLLFDADRDERESSLDRVSDQIKDRFGKGALKRGTSLD